MTNPPGAMPPLPEPSGWPLNCNPKCGMSWGGFNLYGDEASIKEAQRLKHMEGRAVDLQRILEDERNQRAPLIARVAELQADAARLEWLESVDWTLVTRGGDQLQLWFDLPGNCKPETIRAAIDAAIAAKD